MPTCSCGKAFKTVTNRRWCSQKCPALKRAKYEAQREWYLRTKAGPKDAERACACGVVFQPRFGGKPQKWCNKKCPALKALNRNRSRSWYGGNRAYVCLRESMRRSKFKHVYRLDHLKQRGIQPFTNADYDRMLAAQGGRCAVCKTDKPSKRRAFFDVDHDHRTGRVRGLLCERCNRGIGYFDDDASKLESAAKYLRQ